MSFKSTRWPCNVAKLRTVPQVQCRVFQCSGRRGSLVPSHELEPMEERCATWARPLQRPSALAGLAFFLLGRREIVRVPT